MTSLAMQGCTVAAPEQSCTRIFPVLHTQLLGVSSHLVLSIKPPEHLSCPQVVRLRPSPLGWQLAQLTQAETTFGDSQMTYNLVHQPRRAGRASADVIQMAQLIFSNVGDNYFAQRPTCPCPGASGRSHPQSYPLRNRFCLPRCTLSRLSWLASLQWLPVSCTASEPKVLYPRSPSTHDHLSLAGLLLTNHRCHTILGCFHEWPAQPFFP